MSDERTSIGSVPASTADPSGSQPPREVWGTTAGFVLAAVGSAVGLGNMWRFPYTTAEAGGAAFVVLYIAMTFLIGIPVLLAEFTVGRRARLSPVGGLRKLGGAGWSPLGYLYVLTGILILGFYSVIAGWVMRYALTGILTGFPSDPGAYFGEISRGSTAVVFHLLFMAITIGIVMGGVKKGIERASLVMMPVLFLLVAGLTIWAATLSGSGAGYSFYLAPSLDELFSAKTLTAAAGQAFFSLSLGMGAMLTFSSYLSKDANLPGEGTVIAFSDFAVAFVAGLMIFPVIFALGLQGAVGESTLGALFIALPGAFAEMGPGRFVGTLFFVALFIGAVTSGISLLEVVTSSLIDEWKISRRAAALGAGSLIALLGIWPALDTNALGAMDGLTSNVFLPLGGLAIAIFVGWLLSNPVGEIAEGAPEWVRRTLPGWLWTLRIVVPIALVIVLWNSVPEAIESIRGLFGE